METSTMVDIDAAPAVVWGVMTEIERWPEWTQSIARIERLDPGPLRPGSRARIKQPGFPPAVWLVTEVDEGRGFTWVARSPGARVTAHHRIAPRDGGSRVTLSLHYAGRLGPLLGRLTRRVTERYLGYEARGLKGRSEERMRDAAGSA